MTKFWLTAVICTLCILNGYAQLAPPANYELKHDVVYTTQGTWNGRMDVYQPRDVKKPCPLLINVHGGGWVHGRKEDESSFSEFFSRGYVIANVEYRLADVAPAPAAIQDVRSAMAYLATHRNELNIDMNKVIIMGGSAGGHLALMGGLLGKNPVFDADKSAAKLSIKAIIDKYGPADLLNYDAMFKPNKASSAWLGNHGRDTAFINSISPVSYVKAGMPPIIVIHGDQDRTVPITQSQTLVDAITRQKGKVEFYVVKGGKHGNFAEPEKAIVMNKIMAFADAVMAAK